MMFLYEMESKFKIRRPRNPMERLKRVDKYTEYSLNSIEKSDELKQVYHLSKLLFFMPFEINAKVALNLVVCEHFTMSFLDKTNAFIGRCADSTYGTGDTGVKLTILLCLASQAKTDSECATFKLYSQSQFVKDQDSNNENSPVAEV